MTGSVEEILNRHNVAYRLPGQHHHVGRGFVGVDCPWCSPGSGRFRLGIPEGNRGWVSCWHCGGKSLRSALHLLTGLPYRDVAELLGGLPADRPEREVRRRRELVLPPGLGGLHRAHRRYLRGRGFHPDTLAELWGLRGTDWRGGDYCWRVFIPVIAGGVAVSWTARAIVDDCDKRYMNCPKDWEALPAKDFLYGEDMACNSVVVHEGPADCWATGPGAVATMGLAWTARQLEKIAQFPRRTVCFDNEKGAQRRAWELVGALADFPGETYNVTLDGKDAATAPKSQLAALRRGYID